MSSQFRKVASCAVWVEGARSRLVHCAAVAGKESSKGELVIEEYWVGEDGELELAISARHFGSGSCLGLHCASKILHQTTGSREHLLLFKSGMNLVASLWSSGGAVVVVVSEVAFSPLRVLDLFSLAVDSAQCRVTILDGPLVAIESTRAVDVAYFDGNEWKLHRLNCDSPSIIGLSAQDRPLQTLAIAYLEKTVSFPPSIPTTSSVATITTPSASTSAKFIEEEISRIVWQQYFSTMDQPNSLFPPQHSFYASPPAIPTNPAQATIFHRNIDFGMGSIASEKDKWIDLEDGSSPFADFSFRNRLLFKIGFTLSEVFDSRYSPFAITISQQGLNLQNDKYSLNLFEDGVYSKSVELVSRPRQVELFLSDSTKPLLFVLSDEGSLRLFDPFSLSHYDELSGIASVTADSQRFLVNRSEPSFGQQIYFHQALNTSSSSSRDKTDHIHISCSNGEIFKVFTKLRLGAMEADRGGSMLSESLQQQAALAAESLATMKSKISRKLGNVESALRVLRELSNSDVSVPLSLHLESINPYAHNKLLILFTVSNDTSKPLFIDGISAISTRSGNPLTSRMISCQKNFASEVAKLEPYLSVQRDIELSAESHALPSSCHFVVRYRIENDNEKKAVVGPFQLLASLLLPVAPLQSHKYSAAILLNYPAVYASSMGAAFHRFVSVLFKSPIPFAGEADGMWRDRSGFEDESRSRRVALEHTVTEHAAVLLFSSISPFLLNSDLESASSWIMDEFVGSEFVVIHDYDDEELEEEQEQAKVDDMEVDKQSASGFLSPDI